MVRMLKAKLLQHLEQVGTKGASRSSLLTKFNCLAAEIDRWMPDLLEDGSVVAWVTTTRGRPRTHYYAKDSVGDLTPPGETVMPIAPEIGTQPTRSTPCKVCGAAIVCPDLGHPFTYCSPRCRRAGRDGGMLMAAFLLRAQDPHVFAEVAILLVAADLRMRGFNVAQSMFSTADTLWVADDENARALRICPISRDGNFPNLQDFEAAAAVYRDGRIVYAGRNPVILPDIDEGSEPMVEPAPAPELDLGASSCEKGEP